MAETDNVIDGAFLWCLRIYGTPKSVIAAPNKAAAEAKAAQLRAFLGAFQPVNDEAVPKIRVEVERWDGTPAEHAENLTQWVPANAA